MRPGWILRSIITGVGRTEDGKGKKCAFSGGSGVHWDVHWIDRYMYVAYTGSPKLEKCVDHVLHCRQLGITFNEVIST